MRNLAGSVKERLGIALIEDAERRGVLQAGMTIVEITGGNMESASRSPRPYAATD